MVQRKDIRDDSGTRLTTDLAWTSKKVIPRKPGVSKVRATAPRSMSGTATSRWAGGNRVSPPAVSWSAASSVFIPWLSTPWLSSRRLSQRMFVTIERFFDQGKLDTASFATNI